MRLTNIILALFFSLLSGCSSSSHQWIGEHPTILRLATTTSTRDSGLLEVLLTPFEAEHNCQVTVIAVGTGAALKLGEHGEVDVLIVHAPDAEQAYMDAGHGKHHQPFMENYFLVLGPSADPATIRGQSPVAAFKSISNHFLFISRGDDSGTHKKEIEIWQRVGGIPQHAAYFESGQSMATTLMIAEEKQAYVLTDLATYLRFKPKLSLIPLVTAHALLRNRYSVITVRPEKNDMINHTLAQHLAQHLVSDKTLEMISHYRINGESLFTPLPRK